MSFYDLNEQSAIIRHPKGLKIKLRPHQLTSIAAMRELEKQGTIVIDKPDITSGLYSTVRFTLKDVEEFTGSTFIIETNSAILADKVGSGKTYMIIGLILNTPVPAVHDRFIIGSDHFSIKMMSIKESESVNLIVVPHNLANQWGDFMENSSLSYLKLNAISDFDVFFDIDYVTKQEALPNNPLVIHSITRKKNIPKKNINKKTGKASGSKTTVKPPVTDNSVIYERRILNPKKVSNILASKKVFILNVNRYKFFKQIFRSTKWARVIIDEMDSAIIPPIFDEFGNFNWFLTATPTSIFYKTCRRYVNKIFGNHQSLLKYFIVKNNDDYVDKSVVLPKPCVFMIETLLHRVVSAIQDLIPQDVMQLINAGNMKEAVARLNCDIDTEENIVKVLTDKISTELHNLKKELSYVKSLIPADVDAHEKRLNGIKANIARCKTKLDTVKERISSISNECCFICADNFDSPTILDCCKNVFCLKCLLAALKAGGNKCPYCRHVIKSNKEYHVISAKPDKKIKVVSNEKKSTKGFDQMDKSDVLEKILTYIAKNDQTPRILIFSDYSQTFDKIIKNIAKANLQYALLSGIPAHITNVINEFKQGTTNVLMLDSQHYGSGLNLQDANYLILYHRMTPELETQVIGRAQRFGRKIPLKIIYLVNNSESSLTKVSANPYYLKDEDELYMVTNPPAENGDVIIDDGDDSDDNIDNKLNKNTNDNSNKHTDNSNKHKDNSKKKSTGKKIIDSDDSESDEEKIEKSNKDKPKKKSIGKKIIDSDDDSDEEKINTKKSKTKSSSSKTKSSSSKSKSKSSLSKKKTKKNHNKDKTKDKIVVVSDDEDDLDDLIVTKPLRKKRKYVDV